MTAKDLAELMLDGSLGYTPEDDASFIAKKYLEAVKLIEDTFDEYNRTGHLSTKLCLRAGVQLSEDPADT